MTQIRPGLAVVVYAGPQGVASGLCEAGDQQATWRGREVGKQAARLYEERQQSGKRYHALQESKQP
jgi:hypothetical protein